MKSLKRVDYEKDHEMFIMKRLEFIMLKPKVVKHNRLLQTVEP